MSVFNGQAFLAEAVESILNQTYGNFEFVIIDDGSTDRTSGILAEYARRDGRIRVHRHDNRGRALSLNVGAELAKGLYIARMDADDIALPNRFKEQMEFMEGHPEVGLLGGAVEVIDTRGKVLHAVQPPLADPEIKSSMLHDNPIWHPTIIMKRDVALASGGYRKALLDADDYDLWLRMSERTQLANLDRCVLQYRVHPGQVSIRGMTHQKECVLAARAAASLRRRGSPDPLSEVEEVTPELLDALGVTKAEIHETVLGGYRHWIEILRRSDPEAALGAINGLLELSDCGCVGRSEVADTWLKAAGIHYRQGRLVRALFSAGRGVLIRPIIAGRPLKRAFMGLAAAGQNRDPK